MLIYAKGEADPVTYEVRNSGKRLEVAALDLSGSLEDILDRVEQIADRIRRLRDEARIQLLGLGSQFDGVMC